MEVREKQPQKLNTPKLHYFGPHHMKDIHYYLLLCSIFPLNNMECPYFRVRMLKYLFLE